MKGAIPARIDPESAQRDRGAVTGSSIASRWDGGPGLRTAPPAYDLPSRYGEDEVTSLLTDTHQQWWSRGRANRVLDNGECLIGTDADLKPRVTR